MTNSLQHYGVRGMQWRNRKIAQRQLHSDTGYLSSETYKNQAERYRKKKTQTALKGGRIKGNVKVSGNTKMSDLSDRTVDAGVKVLDDLFGQDHDRSMQNLHNAQADARRARNARK